MAAPRTRTTTKADAAGPDVVAVDGVGPDGEAATEAAPQDVTAETAGADHREDQRVAALAALRAGAIPEASEETATMVETNEDAYPEDQDVDMGGRARRVVLFDYWRGVLDSGVVVTARRGQVVKVPGEDAERGEALGGLAPLTDG